MPVDSIDPSLEAPPVHQVVSPSAARVPTPPRDPALPLTAQEIRKILNSCGITERVEPVIARSDGERGATQAQEGA